ncbi:hypothetical protein D3C81_1849380 [compost metagenome]
MPGHSAVIVVDTQNIYRFADQLHIPFLNMQLCSRLLEPFHQKSRILPFEYRVHEPFQEPAGLPSAGVNILLAGTVWLHPGYIRRIADLTFKSKLPECPYGSAMRYHQMMGHIKGSL